MVDVHEGVVHCVQETDETAEYHEDCCREQSWGDEGEYGSDNIGTERLSVEMGDGATEVGGDFDWRKGVTCRGAEGGRGYKQMLLTRTGIMNQARKRSSRNRCARLMMEKWRMKRTAPARVGV